MSSATSQLRLDLHHIKVNLKNSEVVQTLVQTSLPPRSYLYLHIDQAAVLVAVRGAGCLFVRVGLFGLTSNRPPAGLLQPLSVPSRPWSHMDFVTGLYPSCGMTVVPTEVDRFSKAAHLIPLPKLPSARETAAVVLDHVFRMHGLPVNVVSDRGPQFVSRFWTEFCRQLGAICLGVTD